jgi:hypothetical protein
MSSKELDPLAAATIERYGSLSSARLEGESYEEYKERRRLTNMMLKQYQKGTRIK